MNGVPKEITDYRTPDCGGTADPVAQIVKAVEVALENTAPKLAADIVDKGIVLTGGGGLLSNLDQVLRTPPACRFRLPKIRWPVWSRGTGSALDNLPKFKNVLSTMY